MFVNSCLHFSVGVCVCAQYTAVCRSVVIKVYLHVHAKLYICDTALQFVTKKLFFFALKRKKEKIKTSLAKRFKVTSCRNKLEKIGETAQKV